VKPPVSSMRVPTVEEILETGWSPPESAFRHLYAQRDRLYRALALTTGDPALAAEAVDEAMTRAYDCWHRIARYDNQEAWVYRVAVNWSRSVFRKRRREDLWRDPPDTMAFDPTPNPRLRAAIGNLPRKLRAVVVTRYLLDWSTAETAAALGVPESTVKTRPRRALARLAQDLGGESE